MFTIKKAADLAGVTADILRAWERRYAVVTPRRTAAGYRIYDAQQVATLASMRELIEAGWSARQAADEVTGRSAPGSPPVPEPDPTARSEHSPYDVARDDLPDDLQAADWHGLTAAFLAASAQLDAVRLAEILDEGFGRNSFEVVVDAWLMPTVVDLGNAWGRGEIAEAAEHLASHAVLRRMAAIYEASARTATGARVVVGLPAGCHHELGVFAFGCAARRRGLNVLYVGANLPTRSWVEAVRRHCAEAAVLAAPDVATAEVANQTIAALLTERPEMRVLVGGREQGRVTAAEPLGHHIGRAASDLAQLLADVSTAPQPPNCTPAPNRTPGGGRC